MLSLLEMSITGGIFVAVVVILRAVTINRFPKKFFLILWGAALCCLLIPFRVSSPVSVYTAAGDFVRRPGVLVSEVSQTGQIAETGLAGGVDFWPIVWAVVALVCAVLFVAVHLHSRVRYRASLPVDHPLVSAWTQAHKIRRKVQIRCSDQIDAPLTYGLFRPVVLLPKAMDWGDNTKLSFILAHEYAHIRRFDTFWKWVLAAALCIHWFNPLVWVMYLLASRDLELSCDESVVRMYGKEARAPYALTLVGMEERRAHLTPFASSFAKNALEERITAIMKSKKTTIAGLAAALVLAVAVVIGFATSAPKTPVATPQSPSPNSTTASGQTLDVTAIADQAAKRAASRINETEIEGKVSEALSGSRWYDGYNEEMKYTQEQYDLVVKTLKFDGYEQMSIAEFNRKINAAFNNYEGKDGGKDMEKLYEAFEMVLMSLPDTDPNADFLRNTVQASQEEYRARVEEVYSRKTVYPDFRGEVRREEKADVFGDEVITCTIQGDFTFSYQILNQDALTVKARDQFIQAVLQGAHDYVYGKTLGELIDSKDGEGEFKKAVEAAGKAASNANIKFVDCEVNYYDGAW